MYINNNANVHDYNFHIPYSILSYNPLNKFSLALTCNDKLNLDIQFTKYLKTSGDIYHNMQFYQLTKAKTFPFCTLNACTIITDNEALVAVHIQGCGRSFGITVLKFICFTTHLN